MIRRHARLLRRALGSLVLLVVVAPAAGAQASAADSATVVATVQRYIDAMAARDTAYLRDASLPRMTFVSLRPAPGAEDRATERTIDEYLAGLAREPRRFHGRIWDPIVSVHGPIASLVAPYDAYFDGQFSHCGTDHYILAWSGGRWRVSQLVFTRTRDGCPPSPLGPPR